MVHEVKFRVSDFESFWCLVTRSTHTNRRWREIFQTRFLNERLRIPSVESRVEISLKTPIISLSNLLHSPIRLRTTAVNVRAEEACECVTLEWSNLCVEFHRLLVSEYT